MANAVHVEEDTGFRCYVEVEAPSLAAPANVGESAMEEKISALRGDIVGSLAKFITPFGARPIVYADWTASARCVGRIEDYVRSQVLPFYGNTHTTTSITGHQSTFFRHEARQLVAEACNAKITGKAAEDVVLFCGNGTTSCVNKLVDLLDLRSPFLEGIEEIYQPVVFVSSYEHHSNLLPWRESAAKVVMIDYDPATGVSLPDLEAKLKQFNHHVVKIGSFSAASNVTGILTDVDAVSILMHRYQGIACFDYASAAPYVRMDMNPVVMTEDGSSRLAHKDAIFFSGHKFLGGPGASGVLVVKRSLLPTRNELPSGDVGGGTVFYVTDDHHRYLSNREEREEGGTPTLLADVRVGLIMHLKRSIGQDWIEEKELQLARYAHDRLAVDPRVVVLGPSGVKKLPILSFLIACHSKFYHFHFVSVLLNDLFGIQSRGGCMCAGPYAQSLLGLSKERVQQFEAAVLDKHEVLRPGFTRISFPYWSSKEEVDYILDAILFVAEHGWKYLPLYRYNYKTGEWAHTTRLTRFPERLWLSKLDLFSHASPSASPSSSSPLSTATLAQNLTRDWPSQASEASLLADIYSQVLADLHRMEQTKEYKKHMSTREAGQGRVPPSTGDAAYSLQDYEPLRWFVTLEDVKQPGWSAHDVSSPPRTSICPVSTSSTEGEDLLLQEKKEIQLELTAYAQLRHDLIQPRTGEESYVPRYLRLACDAQAEGLSFLATQRHNAHRYIHHHASSSSSSAHTSRATAAASQSKPLSQTLEATHLTSSTNLRAKEEEEEEQEQKMEEDKDLTCATGTCTLRSRPLQLSSLPPPSAPVSFTSSTGKICSGPGLYYPPLSPSLSPSVKFLAPPKKIMKLVGQAIKEWNMIEEGDRLLLGLSGGKDSLALLHILHALQKRAPVKFTLACATVDPQTESFNPSPLIPYVQALGIPYHYLSEPIVALASAKLQGDSLCAFCSRFKRGLLYSCCRTYGYNKLVLAQHLDDLVESFLMSALHNGQVRTMKANYVIEAGDVSVIRPLVYVREAWTRDMSQQGHLPVINENCPACFEQPKERARMKKLMEQEEAMVPALFYNMRKALLPLLHDDFYETTRRIQQQVEAAGQKVNARQSSKRPPSSRSKEGPARNGASLSSDPAASSVAISAETDEEAREEVDLAAPAKRTRLEEESEGPSGRQEGKSAAEILRDVLENKNADCNDGYCAPCFELA